MLNSAVHVNHDHLNTAIIRHWYVLRDTIAIFAQFM